MPIKVQPILFRSLIFFNFILVFGINPEPSDKNPFEITPGGKISNKPLLYSGNQFVRKAIPGKNKIIISIEGNARATQASSSFRANRIDIHGAKAEYAIATGNVRYYDSDNKFRLNSYRLEYFPKTNLLKASGKPVIEKKTSNGEKLILKANEVQRNFSKKISVAEGDVAFQRGKLSGYSSYARFDENSGIVELSGNVRLYRENDLITSELLTIDTEKQIYTFTERASLSTLRDTGEDVIIKAPKAVYYRDNDNPASDLLFLNSEEGQLVTIHSEKSQLSAGKAILSGREQNVIILEQDVKFSDNEYQVAGSAQRGEYYRLKGKLYLLPSLGKSARRPEIIYMGEENPATLSAEKVERNLITKEMTATGKVVVEWTDENNEKVEARSEIAVFNENADTIHQYGSPVLIRSNSRLYCRDIYSSPRKKTAEIRGNLHGDFRVGD